MKKYAINAYTGNWGLVETVAIFSNRTDAEIALMDGGIQRRRPGLTIVIEYIQVR